jgi:hypothetical protein
MQGAQAGLRPVHHRKPVRIQAEEYSMMLKNLLKASWEYYVKHIGAFIYIILPIATVSEFTPILLHYIVESSKNSLIDFAITAAPSFILDPIYKISIIFFLASTFSEKTLKITDLWKLGLTYWAPYVILNIITGLIIVFGLILLVIPGVILTVILSLADFELLLGRSTIINAIRNSLKISNEQFWILAGGIVVILITIGIPEYVIFSFIDSKHEYAIAVISILFSIISAISSVFIFHVYMYIKSQQVTHNSQT